MISSDEYNFWNLPMAWNKMEPTPEEYLTIIVQPWKALFDLITLS
jgi:hypothetical protein